MPWSDPLRLEILKRLTGVLEEITPGNGYVLDFSSSVFRGRSAYGATDPLPMISILENPIPLDQLPAPKDATVSTGGWELVVQGFFEDNKDAPTDTAYVGLADVKKRLVEEKAKTNKFGSKGAEGILGLGNEITGLALGSGVVRPPDEISAKAYFWLTIQLDLAEDLADPYGVNL